MPITYTVDADAHLVLIKWTGVIEAKDLDAFVTTIMADPIVKTCDRSITDVRESEIQFKGTDLQLMLERLFLVAAKKRGKVWKTAAVISEKPVHYGVARQDENYTLGFKNSGIFHDLASARQWVLAD